MVAGMGLRNEVVMTGFVRREELVALYSGAEMLVHPSLYEGFGLPLLEAMACGLPVLCSNRGALPEVAGGAARLVDPQRGDELATAMSGLMADSSARAELRARGLRRAARFTWRRHAEETERFYEDVAAAKARRGS